MCQELKWSLLQSVWCPSVCGPNTGFPARAKGKHGQVCSDEDRALMLRLPWELTVREAG